MARLSGARSGATALVAVKVARSAAPLRVLKSLAVVVVSLAAAAAAMVTLGSVRADVGPVQTELSVALSTDGGAEVDVPPVGRLRMNTHAGPLLLNAAVQGVDVGALQSIIRGGSPAPTVQTATDDVWEGVRRLALRASVVALLAAAGASLLVFRSLRAVALGVGSTAAALIACGGLAVATFRAEAVSQPAFEGPIAQASALLGGIADARGAVDAYGVRVSQLTSNVAQLYGALTALPGDLGPGTTKVLWVSDVHNNPAAYRVMAAMVEQFDVQAIVDTGDSTDLGSAPEHVILDAIGTLDVPYLWVRGNHDSALTQEYISRIANVNVLDGAEVVQVAGLRWAGIGDPRYAPMKRFDEPSAARREELEASGRRLAQFVARQEVPVDVAVVHEPPMATPLLGEVPLVLDGHVHERREQRADGTLHLTQGSSGGAGLRTFDDGEALPLQMSILHFDPDTDELVAVDEITVAGIGQSGVTFDRRIASAISPEGAVEPGNP